MNSQSVSSEQSQAKSLSIATEEITSDNVSDEQFDEVCRGALMAVGGALLFKLRIGTGVDCQHVAAAVIGTEATRQFLVMSLPVAGGKLRVETAAESKNPVAGIAAAYAGLAQAFAHAA